MNGPDRFFVCASGSTTGQQSAARFVELRFQKELRKRWVSHVSATVIQTYFSIAGEFEFAGPTAVIDDRHRAHLGISVWHDTNGATGFEVAITPMEFSFVCVKREFIVVSLAQRLVASGPDFGIGKVTDVTELSPTVAGHVFPPPRDIKPMPRAGAGTGGRDHHAISAV
jgi:hypothetical protein